MWTSWALHNPFCNQTSREILPLAVVLLDRMTLSCFLFVSPLPNLLLCYPANPELLSQAPSSVLQLHKSLMQSLLASSYFCKCISGKSFCFLAFLEITGKLEPPAGSMVATVVAHGLCRCCCGTEQVRPCPQILEPREKPTDGFRWANNHTNTE